MILTHVHWSATASLGLLLLLVGPLRANPPGITWKTDYNSVRREAAERGCPIIIDFGTENCFWCKKLDQTTFRDPAIIQLLEQNFVALRVDADREPALTQALRVHTYPTLVLAGPDGKILGTIEGYMEAARLSEHLQRVVAAVATPDWMARDFQEATRSIANSDPARAVTLLKAIVQDGKDRPVQVKARTLLRDLEQQAADRLARVQQMEDRGQTLEALNSLSDLLKTYAGTKAAADGSAMLQRLAARQEVRERQRADRARDLLALARQEFKANHILACLDYCQTLTQTYGDTAEAKEALKLANEIRGNTELLTQAAESLTERLGTVYLDLADAYSKQGKFDQAQTCLEQVMRTCPGSAMATAASERLDQLRNLPTRQTQFNRE
jgi:outer membrane protein assembly factor BamD (BamD/ComL family)